MLKEIIVMVVSDEQMVYVVECFFIYIFMNKEEYYYCSIFEEYFFSESVVCSVFSIFSVVCLIVEVLVWDIVFKNLNDFSGCVVKGVYEEVY